MCSRKARCGLMGHCVQLALRKKPGNRSVGIPIFGYLKLPGSVALTSSWRLVSRFFLFESSFHISLVLFLTGTFGQIFQGALLDEKDPSKEKQVFVKTVKGMDSILSIIVILICFVTCMCVIFNKYVAILQMHRKRV